MIYQVRETLTEDILKKVNAPPKVWTLLVDLNCSLMLDRFQPAYPVLDPSELPQFDAFLLGIPTR